MTILQFAGLVAYLVVAYAMWRGLWAVMKWADSDPVDWRDQLLALLACAVWPVAVAWWIVEAVLFRLLRAIARWIARIVAPLKGRGQ